MTTSELYNRLNYMLYESEQDLPTPFLFESVRNILDEFGASKVGDWGAVRRLKHKLVYFSNAHFPIYTCITKMIEIVAKELKNERRV